jgi:hypothetical protein
MEVGRRKKSLFIGIPKEITFQEHRVPLTPSMPWPCSWAAGTRW